MTKDKKLNLDNTTKMTLSLAAIFAPLLLNSNTANARFGRYVIRTASNVSSATSSTATSSTAGANSFKSKLSGFLNSRIVAQKPPVDQGPILNFLYTRIVRQPAQSNVVVIGTQTSRRPQTTTSQTTSTKPKSTTSQSTRQAQTTTSQSTSRRPQTTTQQSTSRQPKSTSTEPKLTKLHKNKFSKGELALIGLEAAEAAVWTGVLGTLIGSLT